MRYKVKIIEEKMEIKIRQYIEKDFKEVSDLMDRFQDYLVDLDTKNRLVRLNGYGENHTKATIEEIKAKEGVAFVAENKEKIIGFIAGTIIRQNKNDLLECVPSVTGEIIELFVDSNFRRFGVGKKLMMEAENYFNQKSCNIIRISVFSPNLNARAFYEKIGYGERMVEFVKIK